jgi:hypothetical protein
MSDAYSSPATPSGHPLSWIRRTITYVLVFLVGLLIGFVPMWAISRQGVSRLTEAASQADLLRTQNILYAEGAAQALNLATLQNTLASATVDAQRGDYESARQAASDFFTALREVANRGADAGLTPAQQSGLEALFTDRDGIISLLARSDPAASQRLSDLYVGFRDLMSQ